MNWSVPAWSVASALACGCHFSTQAQGSAAAGDGAGSDTSGGDNGTSDGGDDGVDDGGDAPTSDDVGTDGSNDDADGDTVGNDDATDSGGGVPGEGCDEPWPAGWIHCEDFEGSDPPLSRFANFDVANNRMAIEEGVSLSGDAALRITHAYTGDNPGWSGWATIRFGAGPAAQGVVFDSTGTFDDVWVRMHVRMAENWPDSGHMDLFELQALRPQNGALIAQTQAWSPSFGMPMPLVTRAMSCYNPSQPGSFNCNGENDFTSDFDLGEFSGDVDLFSSRFAGEWSCIEVHMSLNAVGASDGAIESFVNGAQQGVLPGLDFRFNDAEASINQVRMATWWEPSHHATEDLTRWVDDIVISTTRPGCNN